MVHIWFTYIRFAEHEIRVGELAKLVGFQQVSLSHEVMPMARIVPRGFTACADAYLTPHIKQYLQVSFLIYFFNKLLTYVTIKYILEILLWFHK